MKKSVFTIGHSTHTTDKFVRLLQSNNITAIADVRSSPFSKFNPQYNQDELKILLKDHGIQYVFLGKELGARSDDPCCYIDGKVSYERLAKIDLFKSGLERVRKGSEKFQLALMCAEKEPLDCHRTILVAKELDKLGFDVIHILEDGSQEPHHKTIARLMAQMQLDAEDLFLTHEEQTEQAFKKQEKLIAYALDENTGQSAAGA